MAVARTGKARKSANPAKPTKVGAAAKRAASARSDKAARSSKTSKPVPHISGQSRDPAIRVILLPRDTNKHGTIFGGVILSYIDLAGAAAVSRVTAQRIVTVAIKEVVFHAPVLVGEAVSFYTQVTRIGKTSVTVHVDVESMRGDDRVAVTEADITFVCVDKDGRPIPVERIEHINPI